MSRRERRLWFGDWQRDGQADTFVIVPDDEETDLAAQGRPVNDRRRVVAALAGLVGAFVLALLLLSGGDNQQPQPALLVPAPAPQLPAQPPQATPPQGGFGGPDLTGAEAQRAAQAALGKFPGQIERVTRGPGGGGYVVHVFTPDGYEVHVFIDPGFHVQGSDQSGGGPGAGPNTLGPGGTTQ